MAKIWALIVLLIYLFLLTWLSFADIGELPKLGSSYDDKIFHLLSHALLALLVFNYIKKTTFSRPILLAAIVPLCYGITIEFIQGMATSTRTADIYDILANSLGMVFAVLFLYILRNVKLN